MNNILDAIKLCDNCRSIGQYLSENTIIEGANQSIDKILNSRKPAIGFIGSSMGNLLMLIDEIFHTDLGLDFTEADYLYRSCFIQFEYGEINRLSIINESNEEEISFHDLFERQKERGNKPILAKCRTPHAPEAINVNLFFICNGFEDFDWRREFANNDYLFFLLNATMALNSEERKFIETSVKMYFGLQRFAFVVTNLDCIVSSEEHNKLMERINKYAAKIGDCHVFDDNTNLTHNFIKNELMSNVKELMEASVRQIALICLNETTEYLNELEKNVQVNISEIDSLIMELNFKKERIARMGNIAAGTISSKFNTQLKYNLFEAIQKYNDEICKNIQETLNKSHDLEESKKKIPQYIVFMWNEFEKKQDCHLREEAQKIIDEVYEHMEEDAGKLFSNMHDEKKQLLSSTLNSIILKSGIVNFTIDETEAEQKINKISKALLIGAIPAYMVFGPIISIAIAAGSQVVAKYPFKVINEQTKEAILKETRQACEAITKEIKNSAEVSIENAAIETRKAICSAYDKFINLICTELKTQHEDADKIQEKLDYIRRTKTEVMTEPRNDIKI